MKVPKLLAEVPTLTGKGSIALNTDSLNFCAHMDTYIATYEEFHRTLTLINKKMADDSSELARSVFDAATCHKHLA